MKLRKAKPLMRIAINAFKKRSGLNYLKFKDFKFSKQQIKFFENAIKPPKFSLSKEIHIFKMSDLKINSNKKPL